MSAPLRACASCKRLITSTFSDSLQDAKVFRGDTLLAWHRFKYFLISKRTISYGNDIKENTGSCESFFRNRIKIKAGSLAQFADGAAVVEVGKTAVLVTVVSSKDGSNSNFLPLTVDYRQKAAAAGRIPLNYLRRELGPTEKEILTSRMIDRSVRPMFPPGYDRQTLITCNMLALDGENDADVASINGASAALYMSSVPFDDPVGAVRISVSKSEGKNSFSHIVNPTRLEQQKSFFHLLLVANRQRDIVMLEADGDNLPLTYLQRMVEMGSYYASTLAKLIAKDCDIYVKKKAPVTPVPVIPEYITTAVENSAAEKINEILGNKSHDKISRDVAVNALRHIVAKQLSKNLPEDIDLIHEAYSNVFRNLFRDQILDNKVRCDGRELTEVRPISSQVDLYKPLHGSALFQRGQTQVLCTVSFDSLQSAFKTDPISVITGAIQEKNFMLHYEFPSFSINEIRQQKSSRRELGHGALAEKALRPAIPENHPFCIRLTSEVLQSNGSSSMASVCGGTLALMDAGVQLRQQLAGVAMGLVTRRTEGKITDYSIMTDILGIEDYHGDMDFKIAGSRTGFTALQLDLKIPGVPVDIINRALQISLDYGIKVILNKMSETLSAPRAERKSNHPVVENLNVLPAQRARFVGIGGYNLRKLRSETGITITPVDEHYQIFAPNKNAMDEAKEIINKLLVDKRVPELQKNAIYHGKITEIRDHGVMVQLHPAMDPMFLPNSQLDHRPISHPSSLGFEVGQIISVQYYGRDPNSGQARLSRKVITAPTTKSFKLFDDKKKT